MRFVALLVTGITFFAGFTPLYAEQETVEVFNDWILICEAREGALPCDIRHRVVDEQSQSQVLSFSIAYSPDLEQYALQLILPLDFLLQPGIDLTIGDYTAEQIAVTRCEPVGCFVEARLEQDAVTALRREEGGHVYLTARGGQRLDLPFSLSGFDSAIEALAQETVRRQE